MAVVFGVKQLIQFGKQAVETASDLQEVQNVVDTAFGSMASKMEEFAKTSIETFGISKLAAKQTGSTFMAMASGMNIAQDRASDMAIALTGLSADMSSFYNVTQDTASTALKSIFTGETETLKQFGIVMTEANLEAYAVSQGIKKSVKDMSQAEKVQLRYAYVMKQTALAQGDFAKTSNSWANQTRVLKEKWKEFLGILGTGLIRVLTPVVKFLSTSLSYLTQFANKVGEILTSVFGMEKQSADAAKATAAVGSGAEDAAAGLNDMGDASEEANKKASGLSGIDQLNNITESVADNAESAADSLAMMGGGGQYGMEITPTINSADTSALESGIGAALSNIKTGLSTFLTYIQTSFAPIFASTWSGLQTPIQNFKTVLATVFTNIQSLAQPLLDYFTTSYIPYLQQAFTTVGGILTGLFDSFNKVFSDIWTLAVYPLLQSFLTVYLPTITDIGTQTWNIISTLFDQIKGIFDMLWQDVMAPVLAECTKIWTDFVNILSEFWNTWGDPIVTKIKEAITTTGDLFKTTWNKVLKPIWDTIMKTVDKLWTDHLKPLLKNIGDLIGTLVTGAMDIYNKFIAPVVKWFVDKLGPPISKVISGLITKFGEFFGNIIDAVDGIVTALKGVIEFITGVFTLDWAKAWGGIRKVFSGAFDALISIAKTPINAIIGFLNALIEGVVAGINALIGAVNSLYFEFPDWVPGLGGRYLGFDLDLLSAPKIPALATGTVIPPNSEFLALLGDQKKGVNIEAPLDTIVEAFRKVVGEGGGSSIGDINLNVYLEGKQIHSEVVRQDKLHKKQTGKSAFAY